jgi:hypothetical protein
MVGVIWLIVYSSFSVNGFAGRELTDINDRRSLLD